MVRTQAIDSLVWLNFWTHIEKLLEKQQIMRDFRWQYEDVAHRSQSVSKVLCIVVYDLIYTEVGEEYGSETSLEATAVHWGRIYESLN